MEIFRGRRLWIEKRTIRLPTGTEREKVIVHPGNAVAILPLNGERCTLLKQYRYAIDQYIWEAPAGTMEPGEDPATTAGRELIEETGLAAKTITPKGFIYTTPGFTDEKIFLFEARDLSPSQEYQKDEDEVIEVVDVPVRDLAGMVRDGTITDGKTICLICRCLGC
ncbi:MAG: NUDIX hydrolase [Methanoregula sp.]|jgi:ADP-ribose pyrophosphatase|uniref:NUDIX hydrolase n=1 Tax=Methanoregula sp. TaxID=2052170 RepID=UPI003D0DC8B4